MRSKNKEKVCVPLQQECIYFLPYFSNTVHGRRCQVGEAAGGGGEYVLNHF